MIYSFLTERKHVVIVNGKKSKISMVPSGVPQGTFLGPLLFLIYISNIEKGIKSMKNILVEDTKIKSSIKIESDVERLL